ncbi:MAG: endonuclease/exonuclease/phosphatase family protein [Melioribacteraceae bacterium]|nr:endonuclease/exonuclease/phosphatase family protein [Melioribacteraceae bacterium]
MKYISILILLVSINISAQTHSFMTYNIRYANEQDSINKWDFRKEKLADQIKFHEPDVFGLQEALECQVIYLDTNLCNYSFVGVGRDDGKTKGEFSPIYFRNDKLTLIKWNTFWLSETPDTISVGWDAALERICTYALFEDKISHEKFWVFNTHFDHIGIEARINSAKLIFKMISKFNDENYPVFLMGDFNLEPESDPIQFLSEKLCDSKKSAKVVYGNNGTFNGFDTILEVTRRIDYIFVSRENITVSKYAVFSDLINQRYNSDHFPVYIEAEFSK